MRCEPVEHVLEVVYRAEVKTEEAAVLARDPVALGDLGRLTRNLRDALELARRRPDADDRCDRIPETPSGSSAAVAVHREAP